MTERHLVNHASTVAGVAPAIGRELVAQGFIDYEQPARRHDELRWLTHADAEALATCATLIEYGFGQDRVRRGVAIFRRAARMDWLVANRTLTRRVETIELAGMLARTGALVLHVGSVVDRVQRGLAQIRTSEIIA